MNPILIKAIETQVKIDAGVAVPDSEIEQVFGQLRGYADAMLAGLGDAGVSVAMNLRLFLPTLGLNCRTENCLVNECSVIEQMQYRPAVVRDLLEMREKDLLRIPNFGRKSLKDLERGLEPHGLSIGMLADTPKGRAAAEQRDLWFRQGAAQAAGGPNDFHAITGGA